MARRIGILGSPDSWYVRDLRRAAAARQVPTEITVLSFSDLTVSLGDRSFVNVSTYENRSNSTPLTRSASEQIEIGDLDALLVRTMPLGTLEQTIFRMDALQVAESLGVPVVNPPRTLEIAIDKWLTLHRLAQGGLPTPPTVACQNRTAAMQAFDALGGDVLVKPIFGGEGRGIVRLNDKDMAWRVFGTLQQFGQILYVQQFLKHFGYDIRVLLIGSRVLSVRRYAPNGGWRTNLSQGSSAKVHELRTEELDLAKQAAAITGGRMLGIDLLPTQDGRLFLLEVNAVPGWKGTAAALDIDVASLVLKSLEEINGAN